MPVYARTRTGRVDRRAGKRSMNPRATGAGEIRRAALPSVAVIAEHVGDHAVCCHAGAFQKGDIGSRIVLWFNVTDTVTG